MENKSALSNLKILDFTTLLPGPFATLSLADMGADVLKISSKSKVDLILEDGPYDEDENLTANALWINRNKKTISLNLKTKEAIKIVKELVKEYDIVIEQFRPGVMEKLGLSYEELKKYNEKLIYCSITGYGHSGPLKNRASHDLNILAKSGILASSGKKDTGPTLINTYLADIAAASSNAIIGILAAVNYRNLSGEGQFIDISMLDTLIPLNAMNGASFLMDGRLPQREEEAFNGGGIYDLYETKDGEYLSICSLEPKFLNELSDTLNLPILKEEGPYPSDETKNKIKDIIRSKDLNYWIDIFKNKDACVEPVLNLKEILQNDEQVKSRNMLVDVKGKSKSFKQIAMPIKFSKSKATYKFAGREIGSDTISILKNLAYSDEDINDLEKKGVFK